MYMPLLPWGLDYLPAELPSAAGRCIRYGLVGARNGQVAWQLFKKISYQLCYVRVNLTENTGRGLKKLWVNI
jgi:hypothetical protein